MAQVKVKIDKDKFDSYDTEITHTAYCGNCKKQTNQYEYYKFDGGGFLCCFECTPPEKLEE